MLYLCILKSNKPNSKTPKNLPYEFQRKIRKNHPRFLIQES